MVGFSVHRFDRREAGMVLPVGCGRGGSHTTYTIFPLSPLPFPAAPSPPPARLPAPPPHPIPVHGAATFLPLPPSSLRRRHPRHCTRTRNSTNTQCISRITRGNAIPANRDRSTNRRRTPPPPPPPPPPPL